MGRYYPDQFELPFDTPEEPGRASAAIIKHVVELPGKNGRYNEGSGPVTPKEMREVRRNLSADDIAAQCELNRAKAEQIRALLAGGRDAAGPRAELGSARRFYERTEEI